MTQPPRQRPPTAEHDQHSEFLLGLNTDERETLKIMLAMGPKAMERVARIALINLGLCKV